MLSRELLDILACPVCKGELVYEEEKQRLICGKCRVYYEIRDGIPVLLPDSGKPLEEGSS